MNLESHPQKNIILALVMLCIIGGIWYLEAHKPAATAPAQVVPLPFAAAASTPASVAATSTPALDITAIQKAKAAQYPRAIELADPTGFINTGPFKLADLVGNKVVLLDFWTYSCINCQRTIPYLNAWYQKYKADGLVIVGVHTPEFDFEKVYANVAEAVQKLGIQYPVVLDSDDGTWNAYQNEYWPHEYLIDIDGFIVDDHIGEGDYTATEHAIQKALQERSDRLGLGLAIPTEVTSPADAIAIDSTKVGTDETYFGSNRNQFLGHGLSLTGGWDIEPEYAESTSTNSKILYSYTAKNVYFVASAKTPVTINVLVDGASVGTQVIKDDQLYTLVQGSDYGTHTLEIDVEGAGLDAYTFTFG